MIKTDRGSVGFSFEMIKTDRGSVGFSFQMSQIDQRHRHWHLAAKR
jgi:hypothetical protein